MSAWSGRSARSDGLSRKEFPDGVISMKGRSANSDTDKKSNTSSRSRGSSSNREGSTSKNGKAKNSADSKSSKREDTKKNKAPEAKVCAEGTVFMSLSKLKDFPDEEQGKLFRTKLNECAKVFNFRDPESDLPEKEGKRQTLVEILDYMVPAKISTWASEPSLFEIVDMAGFNIFRTLCRSFDTCAAAENVDGEEETLFDLAWPHLELVYEMLLRVASLNSKDVEATLIAKVFTPQFFAKAFHLFESEDPREREALKTVLLRFHGKFSNMRSIIRRSVVLQLLNIVSESDQEERRIVEMLEVFTRCVHGFSTPLKDENSELLGKVLLPLHKVEWLRQFHPQLVECVKKFVEKDSGFAFPVVRALLRYWPSRMASKQILFLSELEEMFPLLVSAQLKTVAAPVARRLTKCLANSNSDVAEKVLSMWKNDRFNKLILTYCKDQFPGLIGAFYKNASSHWQHSVHSRSMEALKSFLEKNPELFDSGSIAHRKACEEEERQEAERNRKWAMLQGMFDQKNRPSTVCPTESANCPSMQAESPSLQRHRNGTTMVNGDMTKMDSRKSFARTLVGMPLPCSNYGFSLSWESQRPNVGIEIQALMVDKRGRICAAVHANDPVGAPALFLRGDHRPAVSTARSNDCGTIWILLPQLPDTATMVIFIACVRHGTFDDFAAIEMHLLEGRKDKEVAHNVLDCAVGKVGVLAFLKRNSDKNWLFFEAQDFNHNGKHYLDILDASFNKILRDCVPNWSKKQRISMSYSYASCGSFVPFSKQCRWMFVGLSWDFGPNYRPDANAFVVSVLLYNSSAQCRAVVSPSKPNSPGVQHAGIGLMGQGATLEFESVSSDIVQAVVVVYSAASNQTNVLEAVQRLECCIVTCTGMELLRYDPLPVGNVKSRQKTSEGVVVGRFVYLGSQSFSEEDRRWGYQVLGLTCDSGNWDEDSVPEDVAQYCKEPLTAFQKTPDELNAPFCGYARVSL